jgi:hypothetical protein
LKPSEVHLATLERIPFILEIFSMVLELEQLSVAVSVEHRTFYIIFATIFATEPLSLVRRLIKIRRPIMSIRDTRL